MGKNAKNNKHINKTINKVHNNPFKNKFGNQKPNFKNKSANQKRFEEPKLNLAEEWGKQKFVPKVSNRARDNEPIVEEATPWGHFKTELIEKEREEAHANAVNMSSIEAKEILKQREQNYRRTLIESQAKQPTKWEKFDEDDNAQPTNSKDNKQGKGNINNTKFKKFQKNSDKKPKKGSLSEINLENFDAKKLTFEQSNNMRKVLTKGFMNLKESSLAAVVIDMQRAKEKKKEKKLLTQKTDTALSQGKKQKK